MLFFNLFVICSVIVIVKAEDEAPPEPPNINIKKYEMCKGLETPVKFTTSIVKKTPTVFLISGEGSSPYDVGEEIKLHLVAETWDDTQKQWIKALDLDEKNPCRLLYDYVGESWAKMRTQLKIPGEDCPLPAGAYSMKDYEFDIESIAPASSIPKGRARMQYNATRGEEIVLCIEAEVEAT